MAFDFSAWHQFSKSSFIPRPNLIVPDQDVTWGTWRAARIVKASQLQRTKSKGLGHGSPSFARSSSRRQQMSTNDALHLHSIWWALAAQELLEYHGVFRYIYIFIFNIFGVFYQWSLLMSGKGWERLASSHSGLSDVGTNQGCIASASIAK